MRAGPARLLFFAVMLGLSGCAGICEVGGPVSVLGLNYVAGYDYRWNPEYQRCQVPFRCKGLHWSFTNHRWECTDGQPPK